MACLSCTTAIQVISALTLAVGSGPASAQSSQEAPSTVPATQPVAEAESPVPADELEPFLDVLHNRRLTGDWGGVRRDLEDAGIEFSLQLTSLYQHNVHGGLQTHSGHRIVGRADTELTLDLDAMDVLPGATMYVFAQSGWNDGINDDRVGSLLGVEALSMGDEEIRVVELWYEQRFLDDKLRIKLGKMDVAVDLDANAYANWEVAQFLNAALVNTGNIPLPDYALGAVLSVEPLDWLYATLVAADAQADGRETGLRTALHGEDYFFGALEIGFLPVWETRWGNLPGGYRFILWYDPQPKEKFFNDLGGRRRTIPMKRDDTGFAFNMDQMIFKEVPDDDGDSQGLGVFFRYGYAHQDVNEIEHFWSIGGQYQGLIPTRDNDVLGFGFAQGIISDAMHTHVGGDRESVYELYYNAEALPWLHVSPDFQYVVNPGADHGRDAFVAGVRVQMTF